MYSISVKWDEVTQSLLNGDIRSYTISYHSDKTPESKQRKVFNAPTWFANLTHLTKNTNYTITVLASNEKGNGPASFLLLQRQVMEVSFHPVFWLNMSEKKINTAEIVDGIRRNDHQEKDGLVVQVKLIFVITCQPMKYFVLLTNNRPFHRTSWVYLYKAS